MIEAKKVLWQLDAQTQIAPFSSRLQKYLDKFAKL